jgi:uncharacterized membrane protein YtjA (UPF0391 family)
MAAGPRGTKKGQGAFGTNWNGMPFRLRHTPLIEWRPAIMLKWALFFFVISLVAALFGFTGISAATAGIARILFVIAIVVFLVFLILALAAGRAIFSVRRGHRRA